MRALLNLDLWRQSKNALGLLSLVLVIGVLPLVFHTPYALSTMIFIGIYAVATMGLCLLMGYAGQVSLGHSAFFGLGAYFSAVLTTRFALPPLLALVLGAICTGAIGYLIGLPVFRLRGPYLAMGTLAFGFIVHITANEWRAVTGGVTGLPGIPRLRILGATLSSDLAYYYAVWAFAIAALVLALNLVNSRFGRALTAIRGSEAAAESTGIEVTQYKLRVLMISAMYASVSGSLYAHYMRFVSPSVANFDLSIELILMAAVGGMASVWGAPFGSAAVMLLTLALREIVPLLTHHGSGEHQIIAYGILLVVIMVFMPSGLTYGLSRAWRRAEIGQRLRLLRGKGR